MMTGKLVSYLRVSTQRQGRSGLGLEAQREAVRSYVEGSQWTLVAEFVEIESGRNNERPALHQALAACRVHGAQLVIAKLDRLSRNVAFLANLMDSSLEFVACDMPAANRLTLHILAAVAEAEATMISARTKAALAAAKARGVKLGGDHGTIASQCRKGATASAKVRGERAEKRANDLLPIIEGIKANGVTSLREIATALNKRGILTSRGGEWSAVQVHRTLSTSNASTESGYGLPMSSATAPRSS